MGICMGSAQGPMLQRDSQDAIIRKMNLKMMDQSSYDTKGSKLARQAHIVSLTAMCNIHCLPQCRTTPFKIHRIRNIHSTGKTKLLPTSETCRNNKLLGMDFSWARQHD